MSGTTFADNQSSEGMQQKVMLRTMLDTAASNTHSPTLQKPVQSY